MLQKADISQYKDSAIFQDMQRHIIHDRLDSEILAEIRNASAGASQQQSDTFEWFHKLEIRFLQTILAKLSHLGGGAATPPPSEDSSPTTYMPFPTTDDVYSRKMFASFWSTSPMFDLSSEGAAARQQAYVSCSIYVT